MPKNSHKNNSLPSHAKKVFEGKRFDVIQWEQEIFDGSKKIFEAVKRNDTVSVIPVIDNEVIIIEEMQPHWHEKSFSLVGGCLEKDEDPLVGVKRELEEETGMTFKDFYLVAIDQPKGGLYYNHHTFIAKNFIEQKEKRLDGGEKITVHKTTPEKLIEMVRNKDFFHRPHLVEDFLIRNKVDELLEMFSNPEKYKL